MTKIYTQLLYSCFPEAFVDSQIYQWTQRYMLATHTFGRVQIQQPEHIEADWLIFGSMNYVNISWDNVLSNIYLFQTIVIHIK